MDLHQSPAPMDRQPVPPAELRCSDADRDRIADILRDALAEGRLTAQEHAERVEGVLRARTLGELDRFVRDLPAAFPQAPDFAHAGRDPHRRTASAYTPAPNRPTSGSIPLEPDENVVAVFSSAVRRGSWRPGRRIHAYAVFGTVDIDLSEAIFEYQQVVIKAISVFGNVEIHVPENVSLRGTGGGVLGTFEVVPLDSGEPDAPVIYVDGLAVLGNVEAKPRRGKLVADILGRVSDKVDKALRKHMDR